VVQKRRQDRAVPLAFERVGRGRVQQRPGLGVAQRRGLALVGVLMAFPMPPTPHLNAEFFWGCPTCRRAFTRPETAARCHRPPEGDPPTVAAPLVRCLELAMFDGHPLALTGWLEADQAEFEY